MRIVSFDQSVRATAAVVLEEVADAKFRIIHQDVFCPKSTGIYRLSEIGAWLDQYVHEYHPDFLVRELHNQRQFGAAGQLQVIGGMIDLLAHRWPFVDSNSYAMITTGTWKKFCLGKGNLKKDTSYMIHINKFIQETKYLQVSTEYQVLDDNIGDAICMGVCGAIAKRILEDEPAHISDSSKYVALKKCLPNMFEYGKTS